MRPAVLETWRLKVACLQLSNLQALLMACPGVQSHDSWDSPAPPFARALPKARSVEDGRSRSEFLRVLIVVAGAKPPEGAEAQTVNDHPRP